MKDAQATQKMKLLFDEHGEELRRFAWYKTGNEEAANDLVQEAFIKLWEKRETVKWESAIGLLFTIIGNLAKNMHQHHKVRMEFEQQAPDRIEKEDPSYHLEQSEFRQKLEGCISHLTETGRETFLMNRIEALKYREIAERLNISVKAVEKRMSKAIQSLTQCLGRKI